MVQVYVAVEKVDGVVSLGNFILIIHHPQSLQLTGTYCDHGGRALFVGTAEDVV